MKNAQAAVTWFCDKCETSMRVFVDYGESIWPPDGMGWCSDEDGEHIFCDIHMDEWRKDGEKEGDVWIA
jgi:hypothetical protein